MKTKSNKRKFANLQNPFNLVKIATSETGADCIFMMKLIDQSFLLEAAKSDQNVVCILRDDTDVSVLLAYWVNREVSKGAKIRNRYNQVPHLTQDTNGK